MRYVSSFKKIPSEWSSWIRRFLAIELAAGNTDLNSLFRDLSSFSIFDAAVQQDKPAIAKRAISNILIQGTYSWSIKSPGAEPVMIVQVGR